MAFVRIDSTPESAVGWPLRDDRTLAHYDGTQGLTPILACGSIAARPEGRMDNRPGRVTNRAERRMEIEMTDELTDRLFSEISKKTKALNIGGG